VQVWRTLTTQGATQSTTRERAWLAGWKRNGRLTASGNAVENLDLRQEVDELKQQLVAEQDLRVTFE
jgi:hypothetical protein